MKVVVLAGGRSSEHDVSLSSAEAVRGGLLEFGHEVVDVRISRDGRWSVDGQPVTFAGGAGLLGADIVFPVLHGPFGEDGTVQGLLEILNVPYVGAGVAASSLCMDKVLFKDVLAAHGIPQVQYVTIDHRAWKSDGTVFSNRVAELGWPLFMKPARLGSSVGMTKVGGPDELAGAVETAFQHDSLAIAEQFCGGLEVECSVIGLDEPQASLPGEIILIEADWYDYHAKYTPGQMELKVPARISDEMITKVQQTACETYKLVGCAGFARVDVFVEGDQVLVNELNTIPGFTPTSAFPKMWAQSGLAFSEVCERLLEYGLERYRRERSGRDF